MMPEQEHLQCQSLRENVVIEIYKTPSGEIKMREIPNPRVVIKSIASLVILTNEMINAFLRWVCSQL